jgi:two-component sensor histidine kinase
VTGVVIAGTLALVRHSSRRLLAAAGGELVPFSVVATVHLFWLCATPVILLLAHCALGPSANRRDRLTLALAVVLVVIGEPLWTWTVVELAHYDGRLGAMIIGRTDLNAMVVVLLVGLELMELRVDAAREQLSRHARLLRSVAEAQLAALTLHLQPHFLFNTLQLVAECARTDAEQAARVVRALRRLLAESARHTTRRVVTAAEEVDFLRAYLSIQLTRFEERLHVEIDLDPLAANAAVPHMLLQPIVENAIQHGIGRRAQGGTISVIVRAIEEGKRLLVLVRDDGPGPGAEHRLRGRRGRGMTNTSARLAAMYGDDFVFGLRRIGHVGAETRIDIPLREVRATSDGGPHAEEGPMEAPLPHRAWLSRLAVALTLALLVQLVVVLQLWREQPGPGLATESALLLFGLRVFLVYGATVAFARAHMLTHWAAARSSVVRELDDAWQDAERDVCRAQVHQPAVLASLRALEESCEVGAEAVDARAQSLAKLLRLCLDALDHPEHDVEAELRIADAYCAVCELDGTVSDITDDATLRAVLPPGTLATAIASLGARPAEPPFVRGGVVAERLELGMVFQTSGVVSEVAALQRALNGAVRGDAFVRRRTNGTLTRVELSLPLVRPLDNTPEVASDVLLSA